MDTEDDRESTPQEHQDTPPSTTTSSSSSIWNTSSPAEAIQLALSQQKLFVVWISPTTPDPAWDSIWTDPAIQSVLAQHAVSITLAQETTEAAMFLQLLSSPPTATGVWIVFSGQLLDSFIEPPSPEDMLQRINTTFSKSPNLQRPHAPPSQLSPSTSTPQPPSQPSTVPPEVQAQLAARRARLEAAKVQYDKEEKERLRLAAARQAESTDPERQKYISQTAKERTQKKLEKAKILQEIENDKLERKKQQQRNNTSTPTPTPTKPQSPAPKPTGAGGQTKVAVRLPDSRVLRGEFDGDKKTLADVRIWIDEQRNEMSAPPYVMQTTFPTRTFEISEEHTETLASILGKGGQIILKEIKSYSDAYAPAPGVVSLASNILGSVTGSISNALGWTNTPPTIVPTTEAATGESPGEAIREARIRNVNYSARERGVGDGEGERERNWFNGNGLAQEAPPRKGEGKED